MKSLFTRLGLGTVLAATALSAMSTPAAARPYYRDGGNDAAIAIGAGILGLAVGAAIADRDDDRYYQRRGYAYGNGYNNDGWYYRDGYYWDRDGRRYDRDEYNRYRGGYDGYNNGYRGDRDGDWNGRGG